MKSVLRRAGRIAALITVAIVFASVLLILVEPNEPGDTRLGGLRPTGVEIWLTILFVLCLYAVVCAFTAGVLFIKHARDAD